MTPSEPVARIEYYAELLVEDLRILYREGTLVYPDHIHQTLSSWEDFVINIMMPCVVSAVDIMVSTEKVKLHIAHRQMKFNARWAADAQRAANAQLAAFRDQHGYEAPGEGPITPWGCPC